MVAMERYGKDELWVGKPLRFAMLSDCRALQERMSRFYLSAPRRAPCQKDFDLTVRIQQRLLLDDYAGAQADYETFLPSLEKKTYDRFGPDMLVFDGLINRDMGKLESGMAQLLDKDGALPQQRFDPRHR